MMIRMHIHEPPGLVLEDRFFFPVLFLKSLEACMPLARMRSVAANSQAIAPPAYRLNKYNTLFSLNFKVSSISCPLPYKTFLCN